MDVNHVVEVMLHEDGTARFEQTVGPDQHVWIRTLRKHTLRVDATRQAVITEEDVEKSASYRKVKEEERVVKGA